MRYTNIDKVEIFHVLGHDKVALLTSMEREIICKGLNQICTKL